MEVASKPCLENSSNAASKIAFFVFPLSICILQEQSLYVVINKTRQHINNLTFGSQYTTLFYIIHCRYRLIIQDRFLHKAIIDASSVHDTLGHGRCLDTYHCSH